MSIQYCEICDIYIDTDYNAEHFEEHEKKKEEWRAMDFGRDIKYRKTNKEEVKRK